VEIDLEQVLLFDKSLACEEKMVPLNKCLWLEMWFRPDKRKPEGR